MEGIQQEGLDSIDSIIERLERYSKQMWIQAEAEKVDTKWAKPPGPVIVFRRLWEKIGFDRILRRVVLNKQISFNVKEAVEEEISGRGKGLFSLEVDSVFWDTTSTYFEGRGCGIGIQGALAGREVLQGVEVNA